MTDSAPQVLVIQVHLHDDRFHGTPEWPPAPARLFQALVAGAGPVLSAESRHALSWLEKQPPPIIGAPAAVTGKPVQFFVPNNDLDHFHGDPKQLSKVRVAKEFRPRLFDSSIPFLYGWQTAGAVESELLEDIRRLAWRVYQFGRGIDMAFAHAKLLDVAQWEEVLSAYPGRLYRPTPGASANGVRLPAPEPGCLSSLMARFAAASSRLTPEGKGRAAKLVFHQPPKAQFVEIAYDAPPGRAVFDFQPVDAGSGRLASIPAHSASPVVVQIRDAAAARLCGALPAAARDVERLLIGRSETGRAALSEHRIRMIPLPSIGHAMVDRGIRRLLVEVPQGTALRSSDVFWAFSGLTLSLPQNGVQVQLVRSTNPQEMLKHYAVPTGDDRSGKQQFTVWRTVTPAVLPETARRRRIDPARLEDEAKSGSERANEHARAAFAVQQALRHAGLFQRPLSIRVQREPFEAKGTRAEAFATNTRFPKERLWHVEVQFLAPISGPLVIGDGRFLGLGVMAPHKANRESSTGK